MQMLGPQLRILRHEPIDMFPHLADQVRGNHISDNGVSVSLILQGGLRYLEPYS
jgi:hypothetical protein